MVWLSWWVHRTQWVGVGPPLVKHPRSQRQLRTICILRRDCRPSARDGNYDEVSKRGRHAVELVCAPGTPSSSHGAQQASSLRVRAAAGGWLGCVHGRHWPSRSHARPRWDTVQAGEVITSPGIRSGCRWQLRFRLRQGSHIDAVLSGAGVPLTCAGLQADQGCAGFTWLILTVES
jgi:hypothetical protein